MNTKTFGNIGLSFAINYFVSNNLTVSLPLNDSQKYDLIVDDNKLKRVAVRSTGALSKYGIPILHLRTTGGNQSFNYAKPFDNKSCEILFAYAKGKGLWCIPASEIECTNNLSLGKKYEKYKVEIPI